MKTNIYIDAREAFRENLDGKGSYTYNLVRQLSKTIPEQKVILLVEKAQKVTIKIPANWGLKKLSGQGLVWQIKAALFLNLQKGILFSPTSFVLPALCRLPFVVTVHDLIAFKFSDSHNPKAVLLEKLFLPTLLKRKRYRILTVSKTTASDLVEFFPRLDQSRIKVTYLGLSERLKISKAQVSGLVSSNEINLLTVGTVIPRKNMSFLINVFSCMLKNNDFPRPLRLHLVGANGWETSDVKKAYTASAFKDQITIHGYLDDQQLGYLYKETDLCVFPSKYEGFGLPLVEAMHFKKPIAAADTNIFREIAGPAAVYFPANDVQEASVLLANLLKDKAKQNALVAAGNTQIQHYSYQDCAHNTYKAFVELSTS